MKTSKKKHRTSLNTAMSYLHPMNLGFQRGEGREKEIINQNNPTLIKVYSNKENWAQMGSLWSLPNI